MNETFDFEIEVKVIDLNVTGFTNIIDLAFNYFEKQKFSHLVAITSVAGIQGFKITNTNVL